MVTLPLMSFAVSMALFALFYGNSDPRPLDELAPADRVVQVTDVGAACTGSVGDARRRGAGTRCCVRRRAVAPVRALSSWLGACEGTGHLPNHDAGQGTRRSWEAALPSLIPSAPQSTSAQPINIAAATQCTDIVWPPSLWRCDSVMVSGITMR